MNLTPFPLLALAAAPVALAAPQIGSERFPASTALEQGLSPDALAALDDLVRTLCEDGDVVGAELLVIKDGRTVLHSAHGWRDREAEIPMATGSVFCVRSMTKPVVGAAIRMLVEDDLLELDDPVAKYLPAFDVDGKRGITVDQLLHHTSGLPMSLLIGRGLADLDDVVQVAALARDVELDFEPGSAFQYSDQGTDTLTALIEVVTGAPAQDFVRACVLEPLGMGDSACLLPEGHPLRERAVSKYVGGPGAWARFWAPDDEALFPVFLGSQALYSTLEDYARFLDLWLRKGRVGRERVLGLRAVRLTLEPGPYPLEAPTGFPGLRCDYGSLMQVWTGPGEEAEAEREVVAFGHTGSDGTHAWAFPEQKAMVLYFTQSRGTTTGLRVEEQLGDLLLGVPFDPIEAAPPVEQYLGYYREGEDDRYRAIIRDGDRLALDILGKAVVPLQYVGDDRWKLTLDPSQVIAFDRDEAGVVTGFHIGDHQELRFEPSADLPTIDEIAARVAEAHGAEHFPQIGTLRVHSRLDLSKLGVEGERTAWMQWPDRWRVDEVVGGTAESAADDGTTVRLVSGDGDAEVVEGARAETMRRDSWFVRFGDWRRTHPTLTVVQRIEAGDDTALLVRAGDTSAHAATYYVDAETGRLGRVDDVITIPGAGRMGRSVRYDDFREVAGALFPHRARIVLANPIIGVIDTTVEEVEVGVEIPPGTFTLED